MATILDWTPRMTPQDQQFYQRLGQRIAEFRKAQGLTQHQLAEHLGISQQTLAHYEVGRLRVSVAMLVVMAQALGISVAELVDEPTGRGKSKRGPASVLQRQIEQVGTMPRSKQKFISEMLEALIKQQKAS